MAPRGERRRKERYPLQLAMQVWPAGDTGICKSATTANLNSAGVQFVLHSKDPGNLRYGASFGFDIELPDSPDGTRVSVVGSGYVTRIDAGVEPRIASVIAAWHVVRRAVEIPELHMTQCTS